MPLNIFPLFLLFLQIPAAAPLQEKNLALEARASASESFEGLLPGKANDAKPGTRWSGIPGRNEGVWFRLDWDEPVRIGEVVIHQYARYVMELDIQILDEASGEWRTVQHLGRHGLRLPRVVACRFEPMKTGSLRIGNITNGPSFLEVEVFEAPFSRGLSTAIASDLRGNFIGIVTDRPGYTPVEGATVTLSGRTPRGEWKATARSDANGMLDLPMPLGLTGDLHVSATAPMTAGESKTMNTVLDAEGIQYGLTTLGVNRETVSLNGTWKFACDPPEEFRREDFDDLDWPGIHVPSHWEMQGFHPEKGVGGYRVRFTAPRGAGRLKLRFEGVYSGAEVWVNGTLAASHEGGAAPFETDITCLVHEGENLLALRVREHTPTSDTLDKMSQYADFPLGGIFRAVRLFRVPETHLGSLEVTTTFDGDYRDAVVRLRAAVLNESTHPFKGEVRMKIAGHDGSRVAQVEAGPWERCDVEMTLPVEAPLKWDAEQPNLYALALELDAEGREKDRLIERIGFRQTEIRGAQILVNGAPVKLRGTCHHDSHPLLGRAVTPELTRQDLLLMKEANLNAIRTSHYPPIPELVSMADEIGLYVEDEAPFCWVTVSDDLNLTPRIIQLTAELVARDRNRPSVVFWSLCNESEYEFGFERSHDWILDADPDRPTSAGISAWTEIATLHNPLAVSRMDEHEELDKPLIFDESLCVFQGIFNDTAELWVDPGIRDYYASPLLDVYDRFMKSRSTQGSMIWCWSDDLFCVPGRGLEYGRGATRCHFLENAYRIEGRGIVGDAPWGVVDGWRRKKPEFWITKKLHSPVKVKEGHLPLPAPGAPFLVEVENRYDFIDLDELEIRWSLNGEKGVARASVPPRSKGTIELEAGSASREEGILRLEFVNPGGILVDAYELPLGRKVRHPPPFKGCKPASLKILEESVLAGRSTRVKGKEFELSFDRGTGLLRRGVGLGEALLLEWPALHVLPITDPLSPLPDRLAWKLDRMSVEGEGDRVRVVLEGGYPDFEGSYAFLIAPDGEVEASASFEYRGEDFWVREMGLRLSVPRDCSVLEWDRAAEWSVYPPDHIGRPRGTAEAFTSHRSGVPPERAWSQDGSPMGSNDFRSTKRNIHWVAVHYPGGPGLLVESNGRRHARAFVESDRISLHVNDWYGGTNVGWWEWTHNYGKGRLVRKGEVIRSSIRMKIGRMEVSREKR